MLLFVLFVFSALSVFTCGNLEPAMTATRNDGMSTDLEKWLQTVLHTAVGVAFVPTDNRPSNPYVLSQVCATIVVQGSVGILLCC